MDNKTLRVLPYLTAAIFLVTALVTWFLGDDPSMAVVWIAVGMLFVVATGSADAKHK